MPTRLDIDLAGFATVANPDGDEIATAAACLVAVGRVRTTVVSRTTGAHIAVSVTAKTKASGAWKLCPISDAQAVYLDQPLGGDGGNAPIGTYYPGGKYAGLLFHGTNVDPARVAAARFVLAQCSGGSFGAGGADLLCGVSCLLCGRPLNDPESIQRGVGPECYGQMTRSTPHVRGDDFAGDPGPTVDGATWDPGTFYDDERPDAVNVDPTPPVQFDDPFANESAPQAPAPADTGDLHQITPGQSATDLLATIESQPA